MPIAFVQSTAVGKNSTAKTVSIGYASANTAGNLLLAGTVTNSTSPPSTITDSAGNTWKIKHTSTGDGKNVIIWDVLNALGSTNTVTLTISSASASLNSRMGLHIAEYSGLSQTLGSDTKAFSTGVSTQALSGAFGTTTANELLFSIGEIQGGSGVLSTENGMDNLLFNSSGLTMSADRIVSALASTYQAIFGINGTTGGWACLCGAYQTDVAGGLLKNPYTLTLMGVEG